MAAYLAEFIGTALLVLFGDGVVAGVVLNKSKAQNAGWMVITTGWGLGVVVSLYAIGRISGGHINPAFTIAAASVGAFPWSQVPGYVAAQLLGAFVGGVLVWLAYLPHWGETSDPNLKLGVFCTIPAVRRLGANALTEFIGTFVLVFGVLAIADHAQSLRNISNLDLSLVYSQGIQPLLVGILVWGIGLSLGGPTGYAINPARDLAPRLAHALLPIDGPKRDSDWGYAWVPALVPIIAGIAAAWTYKVVGF
ncbi:MAG: aquaporin family protein [Acidobacteria bacterium]|nr:MAG: aquaporin family protein [Acidobacteriota bacterium]